MCVPVDVYGIDGGRGGGAGEHPEDLLDDGCPAFDQAEHVVSSLTLGVGVPFLAVLLILKSGRHKLSCGEEGGWSGRGRGACGYESRCRL